MMSLRAAGIELFPPGSMIVQQPKEGVPEEEPQKKKDEL
jgi:hypothetical protein